MSIYFGLYKILFVEKSSIPWKTVKITYIGSLLWEERIMKLPEKWQKAVEQNFNKVPGENEKFVFYFHFKTEGTFGPTQ